MIELETENLIVRNHLESDWNDLYDYLSMDEVYEFEPGQPIAKVTAIELAKQRAGGNDFFAAVLKATGRMIGHMYFHQTEPEEFLTWELGYIFNPAYHNKGYCTEASAALLSFGFERLGAHKVVAFCDPRNTASWKVLEKLGMEKEGHFKQKAFFRRDDNGEPLWHDCLAYGILSNRRQMKRL